MTALFRGQRLQGTSEQVLEIGPPSLAPTFARATFCLRRAGVYIEKLTVVVLQVAECVLHWKDLRGVLLSSLTTNNTTS